MPRFTMTFLKDNSFKKHYQTIVEAENEVEALEKAKQEIKDKGIVLENEVWCRPKKHKENI